MRLRRRNRVTAWRWRRRQARQDAAARAELMASPAVPLRRHAVFDPAEPDDVLVSVGVGPAGEAVALWSSPQGSEALRKRITEPGWASFPATRTTDPVAVRVTAHAAGRTTVTHIGALELAFPIVQPLPDGQVLVVGTRCEWRPDGPEENAAVFDSDGDQIAAATLGDGIQHVRTTAGGAVWVGYFDEGVLGNFGWGEPFGREPLGSAGIVRWTSDLQPAWRYPGVSAAPQVVDCYALTLDGDAVWAYYYADFPIVRITDETVDAWPTDTRGAKALMTGGSTAALAGGYEPCQDRIIIGGLGDGRFEPRFTGRLMTDDGALPPTALLAGRGAELNAFVDQTWYKVDLTDIPTTPPN